MSAADPYEALADLVERELLLVTRGDLDGLPGLRRERALRLARLPGAPPVEARAALQRAAALQRRVGEELEARRAQLLLDLRDLHQAQRAAVGYRPARPRAHRFVYAA